MPKKTSLIPQEEEEEQETQIPDEFEHKKEKKTSHKNMEFRGKGITEKTEITSDKEQLEEDYIYSTHHNRDNINNEFAENIDHEGLPPETTREVALKFLVVMIVILVIVSYLADMSKSLMAHAHSYFHNY
ncbi:hypothetical protein SESBI_22979 [Sesbania bispinosa]|nr:hypothetical protein SESBI_22979 [Sesbania bispinosa]